MFSPFFLLGKWKNGQGENKAVADESWFSIGCYGYALWINLPCPPQFL